uniref:Uncharacterized protein n=1 Tax=Trichobilharzia regenti TaxID=157069 RepID=A0AA85JW95_TRIRE|nr:unnamed protein product [Trichobilharzia regenti]
MSLIFLLNFHYFLSFDDGCRDCICKNDGAYCKTKACVDYQDINTNPEEYCSTVVEKNENNATKHRDSKPSENLLNSYEHKPANKTDDGVKGEEVDTKKSKDVVGASFMSFGDFGAALGMIPGAFESAMQEKDAIKGKQEPSDEVLDGGSMRNESDSMENTPQRSEKDGKGVPSTLPYPNDDIPASILDSNQYQGKKQDDENGSSKVVDDGEESDELEPYSPRYEGGNHPRDSGSENHNSNNTILFDNNQRRGRENDLATKNENGKTASDDSLDYDTHDDNSYDETSADMRTQVTPSADKKTDGDVDTSRDNVNDAEDSRLFAGDAQQTNDAPQTSDEERLVQNVQPVLSQLGDAIDTEDVEAVVQTAEGIVDGQLSSIVMGDQSGKSNSVDNNSTKINNSDGEAKQEDSKRRRSTDQNFLSSNKENQIVSTTPALPTKNGEDSTPNNQPSKMPTDSKNGVKQTPRGNSSKESQSGDWVSREITVQSRTVKLPDKEAVQHMHEIFPNSGGSPILEVEERDTHSFQDSLHGEHEKTGGGGLIQPVSFSSSDDDHEGDVLFKLEGVLRQLTVLTRCVEGLKAKFASCQKQKPQQPPKHPKPMPPSHPGPKRHHGDKPMKRGILGY